MLAWLSVRSEVQTCIRPSWCHCHSLSLASVKSRLVLPFWYRLTRVVPDKGPLNVHVYVCRVARVWHWWWRQWTIDLSAVFVLGVMELVDCGFRLVVLDAGQVCECDSPSALLSDTNTRFYAMARDAGIVAWPTRSTRITESVAGTHVSYCVERWGVGVVICLQRGADCLHMVQLMPLHPKTPSSLASYNPDWFYLSGTGLPSLSWKRGR